MKLQIVTCEIATFLTLASAFCQSKSQKSKFFARFFAFLATRHPIFCGLKC